MAEGGSAPDGLQGSEGAILGQRVGDYVLETLVSQGASGLIFLAKHQANDERVALKVLRSNLVNDKKQVRRFEQETKLLQMVDHPNLVTFRERGEFDGVPFYSMEFIAGADLEELVRERGKPSISWAVRMGISMADCVAWLHRKGVLHRDVTPRNVLIEDLTGRPVLTDLGIAKHVSSMAESWDGTFTAGSITNVGDIVGTPHYMAPEQIQAGKKGAVDQRTDVYGLGGVLYFALLGIPAFEAANIFELFQAIAKEEPLEIREVRSAVPSELDQLVLSCLAKEPSKRPGSAAQVAQALRAIAEELPPESWGPWGEPWLHPKDQATAPAPIVLDAPDSLRELGEDSGEMMPIAVTWGPFELLREIDRDLTGILYEARRANMSRSVLLKRAHSAKPSVLERFRREAQTLAQLSHPNIVPVLQAGDVDGIPYFTMEYAGGHSVGRLVAKGRIPSTERTVKLMERVAQAVHYLHEQGIVHRNLTPRTIRVLADNEPVILGFSVVGSEGSMTIVGDPAYRADEQSEGRSVDRRADIYALGRILFELFAGKRLHDALAEDGASLSGVMEVVPDRYQAIVKRCVSQDPTKRYKTAADLAKHLADPESGRSWRRVTRRLSRRLFGAE